MRLTRAQARALQSSGSLSSTLASRSEANKLAGSVRGQPKQQQQKRRRSAQQLEVEQPEPASPLPDIDGTDAGNPLAASDYVDDIYRYYRRVEPQFRVPSDYMVKQVRTYMRQTQLFEAHRR